MIRKASYGDVPQLVDVIEAHGRESTFYNEVVGIDRDVIRDTLMLEVSSRKALFFVYLVGEEITALVRATANTYYADPRLFVNDLLFIASPKHRNKGHLVALMKHMHKELAKLNVHSVLALDTSDIDPEGVDRLLRDLGYTDGGCVYRGLVEDLKQE